MFVWMFLWFFLAEYEVTDVKYYFPTSLAEIQDYEVPDFL